MSGDSLWGWLWVQGRADQGLPSRAQALTGGAPWDSGAGERSMGQFWQTFLQKCYPTVLTELPLLVCFFLIILKA